MKILLVITTVLFILIFIGFFIDMNPTDEDLGK